MHNNILLLFFPSHLSFMYILLDYNASLAFVWEAMLFN